MSQLRPIQPILGKSNPMSRSFLKWDEFTVVKGTVAPVWVWLQVVWLKRAKIGEEPLSVQKIFHSFFDF
jgi:hypothetical protein